MAVTVSVNVPANTWTLIYSGSQAISLDSSVIPLFICVTDSDTTIPTIRGEAVKQFPFLWSPHPNESNFVLSTKPAIVTYTEQH